MQKFTSWGEELSEALPFEAYIRGWRLYDNSPIPNIDPVQLRDRDKKLLYEWLYTPSITEVFEVCDKLIAEEEGISDNGIL